MRSTISTVGCVWFLSEYNLTILVVSLEDAVHHVFAFVLNGKVTDQLLRRDELWILDQEVGLTLGKLLISSAVGGQVLTWRLDGEGSGLNEVVLATHTGSSGISLLLILMLSQSLTFALRKYWRLRNVEDSQALFVCPYLQFGVTLVQVIAIPQIICFLFLYFVTCRLDLHNTTAEQDTRKILFGLLLFCRGPIHLISVWS